MAGDEFHAVIERGTILLAGHSGLLCTWRKPDDPPFSEPLLGAGSSLRPEPNLQTRRYTPHPSVAVSQRKRRLTEEVFGWMKQVGGLRRARVSGQWKIQQLAEIALSALNLLRIARLQAT
ncbi:MAG: hypothetical protein KF817_04480 [Phycisphaeraceae bacterium]|nr:hypothetical protein [Phycisphaeraceae bacterium]